MIKLVVFDMGGVIINFSEADYFNYLSKTFGIPYKKVQRTLDPLITRMEYGRLSQERFERLASDALKLPRRDLSWVKVYEVQATVNRKMLDLAERISLRYKIALLSNVSMSRYLVATERFVPERIFGRRFVSYRIHMRKPESRIYRYVLGKMGVKPEEAVFIDDMPANVKGARSVGMHAVRFKGYDNTVAELKRLGVRVR
ncbi:MAG: HAD family phosphatase [Candidatus Micrarchaeota archaeon]|nr:HAD family phosphatase [Candidatus Micrarchaeota archaeon]